MISLSRVLKGCVYLTDIVKTSMLKSAPGLYGVVTIRPTSCNIMVTNRCNLKCVMCRQWREEPARELSTEDWKGIIKDLRSDGIRNIHFTGGEPLIRGDLADLVRYCAGLGIATGMTTNATLLDKEKLDELTGAGIRSIALSIDALGHDYEKIRGVNGSFERMRRGALLIAEAKKKNGIDAYVNFTLMRDNLDEIRSVKKFSDGLSIPLGVCLIDKSSSIFNTDENRTAHWISGEEGMKKLKEAIGFLRGELISNPRSLILNFPGLEYMGGYFNDPVQTDIPCVISQDRIFVDPYGNLIGGCLAMGPFGNLKSTPFSKLKRDRKYMAATKNMFYKKCAGCSCGYLFNIRHSVRLILKDIFERGRAAFKRE